LERLELTPAAIRQGPTPGLLEVVFLDSARVYELPRSHPRLDEIVGTLEQAIADGRAVQVRVSSDDGEAIDDVGLA
jgi:hypothetical protein